MKTFFFIFFFGGEICVKGERCKGGIRTNVEGYEEVAVDTEKLLISNDDLQGAFEDEKKDKYSIFLRSQIS